MMICSAGLTMLSCDDTAREKDGSGGSRLPLPGCRVSPRERRRGVRGLAHPAAAPLVAARSQAYSLRPPPRRPPVISGKTGVRTADRPKRMPHQRAFRQRNRRGSNGRFYQRIAWMLSQRGYLGAIGAAKFGMGRLSAAACCPACHHLLDHCSLTEIRKILLTHSPLRRRGCPLAPQNDRR